KSRAGTAAPARWSPRPRLVRSWRVTLPRAAGQDVAGAHEGVRINLVGRGESEQQRLVRRHVIEHSGQKSRLARRVAQGVRSYSAHRQEAPELFRLAGDEAQRRNGELFGRGLLLLAARPAALLGHGDLRASG